MTQDLREWIWPRLAIDQVWGKKTAVPTKRVLNVHNDVVHMYLVPGGRWLLTFRDTGHVVSYDLNLKEPPAQLLSGPVPEDLNSKGVTPQVPFHAATGEPIVLTASMNTQTPTLDFTLVVSFTESPYWTRPPPIHLGWLHIQEVSLAEGGSASPTLQARRLSSIPHLRTDASVTAVGLNGSLIARFSTISMVDSWLEVFRWTECSSKELMTATIHLGYGQTARGLHFIGEDRILVLASYRIYVYRIPPLSLLAMDWDHETGYHSDEAIAEPLWIYLRDGSDAIHPGSFAFDGTGYRLVVQDEQTILGFHIPLDKPPFLQFKIPLNHSMPVMNGLYKGCTVYPDGSITRLRYGSDDDTVGNLVIHPELHDCHPIRHTCFDEETGRCLLRINQQVWVLDFLSC